MNFKIGKKVDNDYLDCFIIEVEAYYDGQSNEKFIYGSFQNNEERLRDLEEVINNVSKNIENEFQYDDISRDEDDRDEDDSDEEYNFIGYKVFYYDKNGIEFEVEIIE